MSNRNYTAAKIRSASFNGLKTRSKCLEHSADVERLDEYGNVFVERLLMGADNVRLGRLNAARPFSIRTRPNR